MSIGIELQKLDPDAEIELYELDLTPFGGEYLYFHAGLNGLRSSIQWQGNTYVPWVMEATGFDISGQGKQSRPSLVVANITGLITGLVNDYDDLVGAKFTRRRTFHKYLDAENFEGGVNPDADPNVHISVATYIVERKTEENELQVEFELATPLDLQNINIPGRIIISNLCPYKQYRGPECGYTGGAVADENDNPVTELSQDRCGKRLSSCRLRFGAKNPLPFGGFPATKVTKI